MKTYFPITRWLCVLLIAVFLAGCEGQRTGQNIAGTTTVMDEWTPIETSQLAGNLQAVLSGLPLKDAKYNTTK